MGFQENGVFVEAFRKHEPELAVELHVDILQESVVEVCGCERDLVDGSDDYLLLDLSDFRPEVWLILLPFHLDGLEQGCGTFCYRK